MKRSAPNAALRMPCTGRLARQRAEMAEAIADPMWRAAELGKSRFDAAQEPPPHGLQEAFKVARCARGCQPPPLFFLIMPPRPLPPCHPPIPRATLQNGRVGCDCPMERLLLLSRR